ncbi:MAG: hypothetical protein JWO22_540 [Frankiales bacterium]|nr:hypothetical protein [Frankiales bacterium]
MRLEGTLDAFSLPDIFQLLSYTKKTGTLHLRRDNEHGVVHLRDGSVTGGRGDATSQALGRRMVGCGLVSDQALADAVELLLDNPGEGLGKTLLDQGSLRAEEAKRLASEQATDAVFELLRWEAGEFAFVVDESDPDDVGASIEVEEIVAEGRRRLETWGSLSTKVPSVDAPVSMAAAPDGDAALSKEEWTLLSLVDGRRTVRDLVTLSGTGEYVIVSALAALADRGLVHVDDKPSGLDPVLQRQQLLAALEGREVPKSAEPPAPLAKADPEPERAAARKPVIPERPEPFTPERQPDFAEEPIPAIARMPQQASAPTPVGASASLDSSVGSVEGAHALKPETSPAPAPTPGQSGLIDRDPSVNKSLLLRLIAGVRGL